MLKNDKESGYSSNNIIVTNEYRVDSKQSVTSYEDTVEFKKIKQFLNGQKLVYVTEHLKNLFKLNVDNNTNYFKSFSKEVNQGYYGNRVILYIRLSVDDLEKNDGNVSKSIVHQLLMLLPYCEKHKLEVVGIFYEEDISGSDENREEWTKSLQFCELGHTEVYLCKTQARFARSVEFVEKYIRKKFLEWNIRFISPVDGIDTNNKNTKKTSQITALADEWKIEEQSVNTRKTLRSENAAGMWTAAFAPYGYKKDPKDKYHLIIDEPAAKTVREIYKMYAEGKSYNKIAVYLNENNIPTPSRYRKLQGSNFYCRFSPNGAEYWNIQTIKKILMDITYDGVLVQHRTEKIAYNIKKIRKVPLNEQIVVACTHEPIVDPEISKIVRKKFADKKAKLELENAKKEAMNLIMIVEKSLNDYKKVAKDKALELRKLLDDLKDSYLSTNIKTLTENYNKLRDYIMNLSNGFYNKIQEQTDALRIEKTRARACKDGSVHLFSQKVVCQCCGRTFAKKHYPVNEDGTQTYKDYLYCKTKKSSHGYTCENNKSIKFDELSTIVLDELNKQIDTYYDLKSLEESYYEKQAFSDINKDIDSLLSEQSKLKERINANNERFTILYEDKADGVITADEFSMLKRKYQSDNEKYSIRIRKIEEEVADLHDRLKQKESEVTVFEKYKHLDKLDRVIVDTFVSKIVIGKVDTKTNNRDIKIVWNYAI